MKLERVDSAFLLVHFSANIGGKIDSDLLVEELPDLLRVFLPVLSRNRHELVPVDFSESFGVDGAGSWDSSDGRLLSDSSISIEASDDPIDDTDVLSVTGPKELKLLDKTDVLVNSPCYPCRDGTS